MGPRLGFLAVLFALAAVASLVQLLAYLTVARVFRIALVDGGLGLGPVIARPRIFGIPIVLRLLPLNCFVRPWPLPEGVEEPAGTLAPPAGRPLVSLPFLGRHAFALLPLLLALVAAALAFRVALPSLLVADALTLFRGALSPFVVARAKLEAAVSLQASQGNIALMSRLLVPFSLGQLSSLTNVSALAPQKEARTRLVGLTVVVLLAMFALLLAWLVAIVSWLVS